MLKRWFHRTVLSRRWLTFLVMGLTLLDAIPFMVEIGVLLDLFVAIFVMGIILNHINRAFASLDTTQLSALRE